MKILPVKVVKSVNSSPQVVVSNEDLEDDGLLLSFRGFKKYFLLLAT